MKIQSWLVLCLILFLVAGCNDLKQKTASNNAASTVDSSNTVSDTNALEKEPGVKIGSFVSGEHPTQGSVRLLTEQNQKYIELDSNFKTSELGPDLVVILHRSSDVIGSTNPPAYPLKEGDYAFVAPLRQYSGTQRYQVPDNINLADYKSVAIWCRKFNATFGAAVLQ